ncbi:MAG: DUF1801 domain-containing protein [Patescibacteria group bacterium]
MNMFKPVGAKSVQEYIDMLEPGRRDTILALDKLIRDTAPGMERHFAYNMLGYGKFRYTNYKKQEVDWPIIALASQKNYVSVYVCALADNEDGLYIAEQFADDLGKVSVGKSCIRFKKLEDLNLETLKEVLQKAADNPGLI